MIVNYYPPIKTAIWDIETNGLLDTLNRIHCIVVRDLERRKTYRFRRNSEENTIKIGVDLIANAEIIVGHNILHFDMPAVEMIYPDVIWKGKILDTLVMSRMCFANQKDKDYRLWEAGKLPGELIGRHGLEAWGWRIGMHKGDYAKEMKAKGLDPWAVWNMPMEDYCENDVDITTILYNRTIGMQWSHQAQILEHTIHDLMGLQERNGIPFNVPKAIELVTDMKVKSSVLIDNAQKHFGTWWAPKKKIAIRALWDDPDGKNAAKKYAEPRPEFMEDDSRSIWADVVVPTKTLIYKEPAKADRTEGAPFCPVVYKEFNPSSREQVIDRFTTVYDWSPVDFTEKGRPAVNDEVLRVLGGEKEDKTQPSEGERRKTIPIALDIAEIFYYDKRIGMIETGPSAWLKKVDDGGKIHHYCDVGGTISGRAAHSGPNLGQVPAVELMGMIIDGVKKDVIQYGRAGHHGYECRELFYVPDPWDMVGSDLAGIELRCLGEALRPYDHGAYLDIVLNSDIHSYNQKLAGLPTRNNAKTFIYALVYGAGDQKLGSIVAPLASKEEQKLIGAKLRAIFMENLPAMKMLMKKIAQYAKTGYVPGLDGRKLWVRSAHSALNTKLQSDGALIAKKWVCLTEQRIIENGGIHGWDGNFVQLLWIHDEIQLATNPNPPKGIAPLDKLMVGQITEQCALETGKYFNFVCPVEATAKYGKNWAQTH